MKRTARARLGLSTLGALILGVACATSPTGRKQLILVPEEQMATLGAQAFQEVKSETPVENDAQVNAYVRCVTQPITRLVKGVKNWEVVVFRSDEVNAFALPGGKIGVYTGLLKVAKSDDQLAAVLGHEVGHVIAKHGAERVSEGIVAQGGLAAIGVLTRENPNRDKILGLLGVGTQVGVLLPHSRTQESEADSIGLDLMARAGFNPQQAVELWKNMAAASSGQPPEFLSTHPSHGTRIEGLQAGMKSAQSKYQKATKGGKGPECAVAGGGSPARSDGGDDRPQRQPAPSDDRSIERQPSSSGDTPPPRRR